MINNAIIESTMLGYEDHGILTALLICNFSSGTQGYGGYFLNNDHLRTFIEGVLKTVGVDTWEKLPGKHVRIDGDYTKISRIGHIIKDIWFDFPAAVEKKEKPVCTTSEEPYDMDDIVGEWKGTR